MTDKSHVPPKGYRIRREPRKVHPHASGAWTASIGKVPSRDKTRLVRKDWYWPNMTEAEALAAAEKLQTKWTFIVEHWDRTHRPTLEMLGQRFAAEPHWLAAIGNQPSADEIHAFENQPPTADELADAYGDATLQSVFSLYKMAQKRAVMEGEKRNTTFAALEKDCRNALAFFADDLPMDALTLAALTEARAKMFAKLGRRTVKNYLGALKTMLRWWYEETEFGKAHEKPTNFEKIFNVGKATTTNVKIPTPQELKDLLVAASDRTRLYALLAMNCGMYQSDVGHLELAEIDLAEGDIFWDREKEPTNEFRVKHDLWPETLAAVKRHIQPTDAPKRIFIDYRKGIPTEIDCRTLAFVDGKGDPIYQVRETGGQYDKITEAWRELKRKYPAAPNYRSLRKATNDILCEMLNSLATKNGDTDALLAVGEISDMFLAQNNPQLKRLYKSSGRKMYTRMNRYLSQVGDILRARGVFDSLID